MNNINQSSWQELNYQVTEKGVVIAVKVITKTSKTEVAGVQNGALKLKVNAPPKKGKANEKCRKLLAGIFDVTKKQILLVSGEKEQWKTFVIENVDENFFLENVKKHLNITGE